MRYVERTKVETPGSLRAKVGSAEKERAKVEAHYSVPNQSKKYKAYKAYKAVDVVAAIEVLFHKKCAYCEGRWNQGIDGDVDHYRPKNEVDGEPHPGYWWLASDWENLLPGCIGCNRARKNRVGVPGMTLEELKEAKKTRTGKHTCFPIRGPARAMSMADDHDAEDPLLIDPTRTKPDEHFNWLLEKGLSLVAPVEHRGTVDEAAEKSIAVYGLNRQDLVEERTMLLLSLRTQAERLKERIQHLIELDGPSLDTSLALLEKEILEFQAKGGAEERFSAPAKVCIDELLRDMEGELRRLSEKRGKTISLIRPA